MNRQPFSFSPFPLSSLGPGRFSPGCPPAGERGEEAEGTEGERSAAPFPFRMYFPCPERPETALWATERPPRACFREAGSGRLRPMAECPAVAGAMPPLLSPVLAAGGEISWSGD